MITLLSTRARAMAQPRVSFIISSVNMRTAPRPRSRSTIGAPRDVLFFFDARMRTAFPSSSNSTYQRSTGRHTFSGTSLGLQRTNPLDELFIFLPRSSK
jgi:hypothetical protein